MNHNLYLWLIRKRNGKEKMLWLMTFTAWVYHLWLEIIASNIFIVIFIALVHPEHRYNLWYILPMKYFSFNTLKNMWKEYFLEVDPHNVSFLCIDTLQINA